MTEQLEDPILQSFYITRSLFLSFVRCYGQAGKAVSPGHSLLWAEHQKG